MMKHPVDGAEMLRRRLELPPLAAIVAFEHHLRVDGTGYPAGVARPSLNLATQLCSIADVYDAMRSQRSYQQAFPTDRILAVLQQNDGKRFDQRLVRRFSQLMGIYPAGNLVRLDTGALAVVLRIHAPDPSRPVVRVIVGPDGRRLATPVRRRRSGPTTARRSAAPHRDAGRSRRRPASIRSPTSTTRPRSASRRGPVASARRRLTPRRASPRLRPNRPPGGFMRLIERPVRWWLACRRHPGCRRHGARAPVRAVCRRRARR